MLNTIAPPHPSVWRRVVHPWIGRQGKPNIPSALQQTIPLFAPLVLGHIFGWPLADTGAALVGGLIVGVGAGMFPRNHRIPLFVLMTFFATALFWIWLQIPHTLGWQIPFAMSAAAFWVTAFVLVGTAYMAFLGAAGFLIILHYMLPVDPGDTKWVFLGAAGAAVFCIVVDFLTLKPVKPRATIAGMFDHLAEVYAAIADPTTTETRLHTLVGTGRDLQQPCGQVERNKRLPLGDRKLAKAATETVDSSAILIEARILAMRGFISLPADTSASFTQVSRTFREIAARLRAGNLPAASEFPVGEAMPATSRAVLQLSDARAVSAHMLSRLRDWDNAANVPADEPTVLARLKTAYTPGSLMFRHLTRFIVAMAIANIIPWLIGSGTLIRNDAHWLPLGLFVALQPGYSATVVRGLQRAGGTLIGGALCFALVALLPGHFWFGYLVPVFALLGNALITVNYAWMVIPITPLVVIGFSGGVEMHYDILAARIGWTAVGCLLAIVVRAVLWPSWKRDELPDIAKRAIDAQAAFFAQLRVMLASDHTGADAARSMLAAGREARTSLQALAEAQKHMLTEPLSTASSEIDQLVPLIDDLRRVSFGFAIRAHQEGQAERERMLANLDVVENALTDASQRIATIAAEGDTQTSTFLGWRASRGHSAPDRIARVESEIAGLEPIAHAIRERVDSLRQTDALQPA